jgi:DNA-binding NarL/FixJ family response regulator
VSAEGQPLRMLLVDDHPLVRAGIRAALRQQLGHLRIEEAGRATEALAMMAAHRPQIVLLDINLPGTNGLDLARRIRLVDSRIKVLMVAADVDPWTVNEAMEAGASGFVAKTNSAALLPAAIDAVLAGRTFLCPDSQVALRRLEDRANVAVEPPSPAVLSSREREVLRYLAHGKNTKTTADLLGISPKTVETHRNHIMRKLRLDNLANLTYYAIRHGLRPV